LPSEAERFAIPGHQHPPCRDPPGGGEVAQFPPRLRGVDLSCVAQQAGFGATLSPRQHGRAVLTVSLSACRTHFHAGHQALPHPVFRPGAMPAAPSAVIRHRAGSALCRDRGLFRPMPTPLRAQR
jgi:hypothetical protein